MKLGKSLIFAVGISFLWSQEVGALVREEEGRAVRGQRFERRHRSRRLEDDDNMDMNRDCPEGGMMGTCAPSAAPSASPAPSEVPTVSPTASPTITDKPTDSPKPTNSPTESPSNLPSVSPSHAPTFGPTLGPTEVPTASPTLSLSPSIPPSSLPSISPSLSPSTLSPSDVPSRMPLVSPTDMPSVGRSGFPSNSPALGPTESPTQSPRPTTSPAPSATPQPTPDLLGFDTRTIGDEVVGFETISECRADIPSDAVSVEPQLATFDYVLNVLPDASLIDILVAIEFRLHEELAEEYMKCAFMSGPSFHVHTLSTQPQDKESQDRSCTDSEDAEGAVCHHIEGGFTATIFYLPIDGRRLVNETITDRNVRDSFNASLTRIFGELEVPGVVSLDYVSLTNDDTTEKRGIETESSNNAGAIAGGVVGGIAGAVLLVAIGIFATRRKRQEREISEESLDNELKEVKEGGDDDDIETVQVENLKDKVAVVNDDESFEEGFPNVGDTNREDDPVDPTFVKTEDSAEDITAQVPDEDQFRSMQAAVEEELGPSAYEAKQPREYEVSDTVDL